MHVVNNTSHTSVNFKLLNTEMTATEILVPSLEQEQMCGGVKPVNGIS